MSNDSFISELNSGQSTRYNEAWFSAVLSIAPSAIILVDGYYRIALFNVAAAKLFGYEPDEIIGKPLDMLIPDRFRSIHRGHVERFWASRENARRMGERQDVAGLRKDGSEFPAEASIAKIEVDGRRTYIVVLRDITERKAADRQQEIIAKELAHRSKNLLSVIQAVSMQTLSNSSSINEARHSLNQRIKAMARTFDTLIQTTDYHAPIIKIVQDELDMFLDHTRIHGPNILLNPSSAHAFALIIHELATNAAKYGALSVAGGVVDVRWRIETEQLHFSWTENGGPRVSNPKRFGFGSLLTEDMASKMFDGAAKRNFFESGLNYEFTASLSSLT